MKAIRGRKAFEVKDSARKCIMAFWKRYRFKVKKKKNRGKQNQLGFDFNGYHR